MLSGVFLLHDMALEEKKESFRVLSFAWELGYMIVIPLVAGAMAGWYADTLLHTRPFLFLTGVVVSLVVTTIIVYRKTKSVLDALEKR